jgi:hypothetical protein
LQPNVDFLKETLTVQAAGEVLARAVERLAGQPEYDVATRIREDLPLCDAILKARCAELPNLLETVQQSTTDLSWSA